MNTEQKNKKILLHACCAICSGHPIQMLKEMGYEPIVYFCNPNIVNEEEFNKRLEAQKKLCEHFNVQLIVENYNHDVFINYTKGLENEPEGGLRCDKCFELRLTQTAEKAKELGITEFTTSLVISPHKSFEKISNIAQNIAQNYNLNYLGINFKKKDGFLKTNQIARQLDLYRQNFCGCRGG